MKKEKEERDGFLRSLFSSAKVISVIFGTLSIYCMVFFLREFWIDGILNIQGDLFKMMEVLFGMMFFVIIVLILVLIEGRNMRIKIDLLLDKAKDNSEMIDLLFKIFINAEEKVKNMIESSNIKSLKEFIDSKEGE